MQLDKTAALIVIDLQKGTVAAAPPSAAEVVARVTQLARAFREGGLPVVLVNVAGRAPGRTDAGSPKMSFPSDWTDLVPELDPQPSDSLITKHCFGAFIGTQLDAYLRQRGVTQIVLAGISTSIGVESTARSAYDLGYNVAFVTDAMTDRDPDNHRHSIEKIFPRLGESVRTGEVLTMLGQNKI